MRASIKIAKVFGIPVLLHWSFLLLIAWAVYYGQTLGLNAQEMCWWTLFGVAVFVCILLHEFGHALAARHYGVETRDIVLFPIGGMARLDRLPEKPTQELLVALAGPLVNVLIATVLFPFFWFMTRPQLSSRDIPNPDNLDDNFFLFFPLLLFLNLLLAIFNLIPAFPMDGGRILRALLSVRWGRLKATKVAVFIGHILAMSLIVLGIWFGRYVYFLIGLFISYTAMREYRWVKTEYALASHTVSEVFLKEHFALSLSDSLRAALDVFEKTGQQSFFVFDEMNQPTGTIDIGEIRNVNNPLTSEVKDFYIQGIEEIEKTATLKEANERLLNKMNNGVLAVIQDGRLEGLLTEDMIWNFLVERQESKKNRE